MQNVFGFIRKQNIKQLFDEDKKLEEITKNIDFSELCITSKAEISFKENLKTSAQTNKATGTKCTLCWKISENACDRTHCPKNT